MKYVPALVLGMLLFPAIASALPSSGSVYISVPNNSVRCVNILLPDDGGYFGREKVDYVIIMEPDPYMTWSDFSYQEVGSDQNNTAKIPICFSSFGKPIGNCSEPFTLRIMAPSAGVDKTWHGGACASSYADFDTSAKAGDSISGLDDADIFSTGFSERKRYAKPGEETDFTLYVESYAELELELSVQADAGLSVSMPEPVLQTGPGSSFHEVALKATAPGSGTYAFTVTASAKDCGSGSMCSRQAVAELATADDMPQLDGFTVSVFPENINVKDLQPVTYRLAIINMGETDEFSVSSKLPDGVGTTFSPATITVPSGGHRTITFEVSPQKTSSSYELEFTVKSGSGVEKPATAYLSTNEMLTDSLRSLENINYNNPGKSGEAQDELDSWYRAYKASSYGDGLDEYSGLQDTLKQARETVPDVQGNGTPDDVPYDEPDENGDKGINPVYVVLLTAAVVLGAAFLIIRKKGNKSVWDEEL